jgi:fatty acid amide hydrolase 2
MINQTVYYEYSNEFSKFALTDMVQLLLKRELSAEKLLILCRERLESCNEQCHVIDESFFSQAQEQAVHIQKWIDSSRDLESLLAEKPLLGLPFVVQSSIGLKGASCSVGSWARHGMRAPQTATVVKRIVDAGGILLASTQTTEFDYWTLGGNPVQGAALNPWQLRRSAGSSAGATAAAVASRGGVFGIAHECDGSARLSAGFCGVFAHKPTRGLVPLSGVFPYRNSSDLIALRSLDSIAPITAHAMDLKLVLSVIKGSCDQDPMSRTAIADFSRPSSKITTVGVIENPRLKSFGNTDAEIRLGIKKCVGRLTDSGVKVISVSEEIFYDTYRLWRLMVHRTYGQELQTLFAAGRPKNSKIDFLRHLLGQGEHCLDTALQLAREESYIASHADELRSLDADIGRLQARLALVFRDCQLLILPTYPHLAPPILSSMGHNRLSCLTGLSNLLGFPSLTLPTGISSSGIPVGVQFVAPLGRDLELIAASQLCGEWHMAPAHR